MNDKTQSSFIADATDELTIVENELVEPPKSRKAKVFIPDDNEELNKLPESITAGEKLPNISDYSSISLKALPLKGIKTFTYSLVLLLFLLFSWEVFSVVKSALEIHWLLAGAFLALLFCVTLLGIRALWSYFGDHKSYEQLQNIQAKAMSLTSITDMGNAQGLIADLKKFYQGKPQALYFNKALENLPDYSNDREVVVHIDNVFIQRLDEEALRRISTHSLQSGLAVALSPWASLDMLLALWRSIKMIDSIAEIYGTRPSLLNRYRLLKLVIHQLAFVAVSDLMIDNLIEESVRVSLVGAAGTRLGQGLGAGIYSVKIGLAAMKVSRPIEFSEHNSPKIKSIIASVVSTMMKRLKENTKAV